MGTVNNLDYIEPGDRTDAWAAMAAELAGQELTHADIAYALCVDEPTVARLLALTEAV